MKRTSNSNIKVVVCLSLWGVNGTQYDKNCLNLRYLDDAFTAAHCSTPHAPQRTATHCNTLHSFLSSWDVDDEFVKGLECMRSRDLNRAYATRNLEVRYFENRLRVS